MCFGTSSGNARQLCHFGPIIAIFLITLITVSGLHCMLIANWWPATSTSGKIHLAIYLTWPILIFYNYFNAVFLGPGFVPNDWRPENADDEKKLQFCKVCNSFKAPRSHHCRKCNRCVLKMDHHCPWINTCCGHRNHSSFVYFLLFAPLGCIHAMFVIGPSIYRAVFRNYYIYYRIKDVPIVDLSLMELIVCMFAIGMAVGVTIAVGILCFIQIKSILKNQTGVEDWIVKKAIHRRKHFRIEDNFAYPYDLGRLNNLRQVFNWSGDMRPIGDGLWWNVADGCDQFTLTVEQLAQKEEKRVNSVKYKAIKAYSGSFCPCNHGCKTACCVPWSEDPRIKLAINDIVIVTRWNKHWLYGEVVVEDQGDKLKLKTTSKGWFPSNVVLIHEQEQQDIVETSNSKTHDNNKKEKKTN